MTDQLDCGEWRAVTRGRFKAYYLGKYRGQDVGVLKFIPFVSETETKHSVFVESRLLYDLQESKYIMKCHAIAEMTPPGMRRLCNGCRTYAAIVARRIFG